MEFSNKYIVGFALALCLICSAAVSSLAVGLKDKQEANRLLDKQMNVLRVAQLIDDGETPTPEKVAQLFEDIKILTFDQATGNPVTIENKWKFNPLKNSKTDADGVDATDPLAKKVSVKRMPKTLLAYQVNTAGKECLVLPIYGNGLWSLLLGFLAIETDASKVVGITFYEHLETPGLGGEIDNPNWKALWPGKLCFDDNGNPAVEVVKQGAVKNAATQVDGISGATITSKAVGNLVQLWLGDTGYGPFLRQQIGAQR